MKFQLELQYKNILVIDIETASAQPSYKEMDERMQHMWNKKASFLNNDDELSTEELYFQKGAIYAEFGKIICISVGIFTHENAEFGLRIKSFASENEVEVLESFKNLIETKFNSKDLLLVAHNGKEFDFPYICRRMLANSMIIPDALDIRDKKPWDIRHIDTMEMWKFGDRKNFTSLELLAVIFDIESSKDDIDGSMVNDVYYNQNDLERISTYCQRDVMVTSQVMLCLNSLPKIRTENIEYLP
jgi:hypothetical protein